MLCMKYWVPPRMSGSFPRLLGAEGTMQRLITWGLQVWVGPILMGLLCGLCTFSRKYFALAYAFGMFFINPELAYFVLLLTTQIPQHIHSLICLICSPPPLCFLYRSSLSLPCCSAKQAEEGACRSCAFPDADLHPRAPWHSFLCPPNFTFSFISTSCTSWHPEFQPLFWLYTFILFPGRLSCCGTMWHLHGTQIKHVHQSNIQPCQGCALRAMCGTVLLRQMCKRKHGSSFICKLQKHLMKPNTRAGDYAIKCSWAC